MKAALFFVLFALLGAAEGPKEEAARADMKKVQGTWVAASIVRDGDTFTDSQLILFKLVVTGDRYKFSFGPADVEGAYQLDPTRKIKQIDSRPTTGANKGDVYRGIYALEGDTLKICFAAAGKERPAGFVSEPGSRAFLAVLKRPRQ